MYEEELSRRNLSQTEIVLFRKIRIKYIRINVHLLFPKVGYRRIERAADERAVETTTRDDFTSEYAR